jgi:hypothetical protein
MCQIAAEKPFATAQAEIDSMMPKLRDLCDNVIEE